MLYASNPQTEQNNHECMRSATIVFITGRFIDYHFPRNGLLFGQEKITKDTFVPNRNFCVGQTKLSLSDLQHIMK